MNCIDVFAELKENTENREIAVKTERIQLRIVLPQVLNFINVRPLMSFILAIPTSFSQSMNVPRAEECLRRVAVRRASTDNRGTNQGLPAARAVPVLCQPLLHPIRPEYKYGLINWDW